MSLPLDHQLHFNPLSASDVPSLGPSAPFQPPFCVRCPFPWTFNSISTPFLRPMSLLSDLQSNSPSSSVPDVPFSAPPASFYLLHRSRCPIHRTVSFDLPSISHPPSQLLGHRRHPCWAVLDTRKSAGLSSAGLRDPLYLADFRTGDNPAAHPGLSDINAYRT